VPDGKRWPPPSPAMPDVERVSRNLGVGWFRPRSGGPTRRGDWDPRSRRFFFSIFWSRLLKGGWQSASRQTTMRVSWCLTVVLPYGRGPPLGRTRKDVPPEGSERGKAGHAGRSRIQRRDHAPQPAGRLGDGATYFRVADRPRISPRRPGHRDLLAFPVGFGRLPLSGPDGQSRSARACYARVPSIQRSQQGRLPRREVGGVLPSRPGPGAGPPIVFASILPLRGRNVAASLPEKRCWAGGRASARELSGHARHPIPSWPRREQERLHDSRVEGRRCPLILVVEGFDAWRFASNPSHANGSAWSSAVEGKAATVRVGPPSSRFGRGFMGGARIQMVFVGPRPAKLIYLAGQ